LHRVLAGRAVAQTGAAPNLAKRSSDLGTWEISQVEPSFRLGRHGFMNQVRDRQILQERLERCRQLAKEFPSGLTAQHIRDIEAEILDDVRTVEAGLSKVS